MSVQTRTTALQNEIVRLYCQFERDGRLANPAAQPLVEIIDNDGVTILDTVSPQIEHTGLWYADWYVPATLPVGNYYDRWTFQWSGESSVSELVQVINVYTLDSYINFISPGVSHSISNRVFQLSKDLANDFIYEAQHIPVYWEQGMRVQQENQKKRIHDYYYFTLDKNIYSASEGDIYFNGGHKFTVTKTITPLEYESTSSESSSSSQSEIETSSSSSSSNSSSSSSSLSSSSSPSSQSHSESSSSSTSFEPVTTTTTTTWVYKTVLGCVGTGMPEDSGILTKISGDGDQQITYESFERKRAQMSTIYSLAYKNWNRDPRPIVRLNNRMVDDGWYTNWDGRIFFDRLMAPEDTVYVSYNFAYFSDEEILSFLNLGLQMMNTVPPSSVTYRNLINMPNEWNAPVLLFAAMTALRRLIFGLNWQEKFVIFSRPDQLDAGNTTIQNLKDLLSQYTEIWNEVRKDVKTRKIPPISQGVTPEYTLPGGRCLSASTYIDCKIDGKVLWMTISDIYIEFEKGKIVEVMSMVGDRADYSLVTKVWKSGQKKTYVLKTDNDEIRLTEEHLVYMPKINNYKPLMDIDVDDDVLVLEGKNFVEKHIIELPKEYGVEDVYDLEVPSSENFVGNNIVSHNSRWFRYMYKTN